MKKIIHLSDLHFGTEYPTLVTELLAEIKRLQADLVIISGDLTQRAKSIQFEAAKTFISSIETPILCVPGNHDISLYNLYRRFIKPFDRYKQWILKSSCNSIVKDDVAVLGINSVTPFKPMGGYITHQQLNLVKDFFKTQQEKKIKIVTMHHNLIRSERHKIINNAEGIINLFAQSNVNLVLCGHIHQPLIEALKRNYLSHHMYVITAGTAISNRTIAPNSFNVIELEDGMFKLMIKAYENHAFQTSSEQTFPL